MCKINYGTTQYSGDFVSFPTPTLDYLLVKIGDEYFVTRTLEHREKAEEYKDVLMYVDESPVIVLFRGLAYDAAIKKIESYRDVLMS